MTNEEALRYIHSLHALGSHPGLDNTRALLAAMGNPQTAYRCLHVAGTNGKGSFCAMSDAILRAAGYRVGLYTSPYVVDFAERIRVDGENIPPQALADITARVRAAAETLAACLRSLFPKNLSADAPCMLAALGNRAIIADAVGPMTADHFIVTRHIKAADKAMFDSLGLRETLCVVPGVSGNTGMEAAEIAAGVSSLAKPGFIVAVDALASRRLSRLATTVQICDTGISPGSGIYNTRKAFDKETFGVPVIAIGVPTVVEVTTLAIDVIQTAFQSMEQAKKPDEQTVGGIIDKIAAHHGESFFVTPKETDHILKDTAKLIGYGLNLALHDTLSFDDIDEFLS